MSFVLELRAIVESWDDAERATEVTSAPGLLPVVVDRSRRSGSPNRPSIRFSGAHAEKLLDEDADWSQESFSLNEEGRQALAGTILALGSVLDCGWGVRACWVDDELREEASLSAVELAALVRESRLKRSTLYRVASR